MIIVGFTVASDGTGKEHFPHNEQLSSDKQKI